jgi:hypothetical protein
MTDDERRRFNNLLLLCGACHSEVDDPAFENDFPVELLQDWKIEQFQNDWKPGDHVKRWGRILVAQNGKHFELPYFETDDGETYFSEIQWKAIKHAQFAYIAISKATEALRQTRSMNAQFIEQGVINPNSTTETVDQAFSSKWIPEQFRPEFLDDQNSALAQVVFSLVKGNTLTLDQWYWLATNPETTIIESVGSG